MNTYSKTTSLAAAAALFALSTASFGAMAPKGSTGAAVAASDKVHCYGVTECKGQADCKTTQNACKGQGSCKGMGFKAMQAKECLATGGTIGDISAAKKK
jgi:hypothetical protein